VTNNRHGLADGVVQALAETQCVRAVLYNSCNHGCLAGEWAQLFPAGFEIAEFASSDLLAGTEFDSSIFLLLRRPRTLVLPIGPPTSGKSALARGLASLGAESGGERVAPQGGGLVDVFERDRRFAAERSMPGGLRGAKSRTHAALLAALARAQAHDSSVLYIDSTNAARSARLAYREALQPARAVYLLLGLGALASRPREAAARVLERVLGRHGSAACPAHERRQWEAAVREDIEGKVGRLIDSIELPEADELELPNVEVMRCSGLPSKSDLEDLIWRLFLLICCPALMRAGPRPPVPQVDGPVPLSGRSGRVALCFLTSARAADVDGSVLWNDVAWQWLAQDFEARSSQALETAFCVLRHDDSSEAAPPPGGFLACASSVEPVPGGTRRAGLSLVFAELRLLRAALAAGCEFALLLSGSCLPLCPLDALRDELLRTDRSVLQYHFCKGGHQRLFGIEYGALQWKAWHRQELEVLAALEEAQLTERWGPHEEALRKYNLAPDEVALVEALRGQRAPLEERCERRPTTYVEWEEPGDGPRHARTFPEGVPEAAWQARAERGVLLCRKVSALGQESLGAWKRRLQGQSA